jgi:hypothetical protein
MAASEIWLIPAVGGGGVPIIPGPIPASCIMLGDMDADPATDGGRGGGPEVKPSPIAIYAFFPTLVVMASLKGVLTGVGVMRLSRSVAARPALLETIDEPFGAGAAGPVHLKHILGPLPLLVRLGTLTHRFRYALGQ